ncbi:hypothetical protein LUZ60_007580 [Juncus effusus]|nr:hypothetical protein LUZ60_007580 [Juncus effusus]
MSSSSSLSTTPTTSTAKKTAPSLELLSEHLSSQNFRQADEVTRKLLIVLAGESAQKRGYVFFSEVQFISSQDLREIDQLWKKHSNGRFGYSIQKKLFEKSKEDFTKFFIRIGWMKKLDTEIEQFNYRAFPDEFVWELNDETPLGHLPLTNALRGTQLLASIFNHPAFEEEEGSESEGEEEREKVQTERGKESRPKLDFKADYSF